MRRWIPIAGVVVAALALAGIALARFTQTAEITLTAHAAGQSSGIDTTVRASDPAALGQKPKALTKLVITFPAGTRFDLQTPLVDVCTRTDAQLENQFGPSCPPQSEIGTGSAIANASPTLQIVKADVTAYVRGSNHMLLVVKPTLAAFASQIFLIRGSFSGTKLTITVPRVVIGKGRGFPGVTVVLVSLKLDLGAMGSGSTALMTAGDCTAHRFVVKSHFVYANHSTLNLQSSSACN